MIYLLCEIMTPDNENTNENFTGDCMYFHADML